MGVWRSRFCKRVNRRAGERSVMRCGTVRCVQHRGTGTQLSLFLCRNTFIATTRESCMYEDVGSTSTTGPHRRTGLHSPALAGNISASTSSRSFYVWWCSRHHLSQRHGVPFFRHAIVVGSCYPPFFYILSSSEDILSSLSVSIICRLP